MKVSDGLILDKQDQKTEWWIMVFHLLSVVE